MLMITVSSLITTRADEPCGPALGTAANEASEEDPFACVVIVVGHPHMAGSVPHFLLTGDAISVAVQTGKHLATGLARPIPCLLSAAGSSSQQYEPQVVRRHDFRPATDREEYHLNLMLFTAMPQERLRDYYARLEEITAPEKALARWAGFE